IQHSTAEPEDGGGRLRAGLTAGRCNTNIVTGIPACVIVQARPGDRFFQTFFPLIPNSLLLQPKPAPSSPPATVKSKRGLPTSWIAPSSSPVSNCSKVAPATCTNARVARSPPDRRRRPETGRSRRAILRDATGGGLAQLAFLPCAGSGGPLRYWHLTSGSAA